MRYSSPNPDDETDKFFEDNEEDDFDDMFFEENPEFKIAELNLIGFNLNRKILMGAVKFLENSFWWKFYSQKTKLKLIMETYYVFNDLVEQKPPVDESEEEDAEF